MTHVRGLITDEIAAELACLAAQVPAGQAIVELGSFEGRSTVALAGGAADGVVVVAVDLWDDPRNVAGKHNFTDPGHRERFEENTAGFGVIAMQASTAEAAESYAGPPVGLLFVDADHTAESVRADVEAWWPHLADDAVVAFDDYGTRRNPGVKAVADTLGAVRVVAGHLGVLRR
jgi:predicted O-methyltransferase YrrM